MNLPFSGSGGGVSSAELRGDVFTTRSNGACWPGGLGGSTVSCGGGVGRIVAVEERSALVGIGVSEYQVARGD